MLGVMTFVSMYPDGDINVCPDSGGLAHYATGTIVICLGRARLFDLKFGPSTCVMLPDGRLGWVWDKELTALTE